MTNGSPTPILPTSSSSRDIFLSHRSLDKEFARRLAADIEKVIFQGRNLSTWIDEAEIHPGQSVPGMINYGQENSRFIGLVMTPAYFKSETGWTDAEWHAALHADPDNRRGRIIPILAADCPYIPILLRHLSIIDFRENRYSRDLQELLRSLRNEPLPRPVTCRGQLVSPVGRIDQSTIVAARAIPESFPDVITERLFCNLLPIEQLPSYLYSGTIAKKLCHVRADETTAVPSKSVVKGAIRQAQIDAKVERPFMPAFRLIGDKVVTFHNLEVPDGPLSAVVEEDDVEVIPITQALVSEEDRKVVVSLINMAISRHAQSIGLVIDNEKKGRFFFPPKDGGPHVINWFALRKKAPRTVAKPCTKDGQVLFWRHLGAYIAPIFIGNKFYVQITPTWVITDDGYRVRTGPKVGRLIINWTGPERNLHLLYHIRFWTAVLAKRPGILSIRAGDQRVELSNFTAFVQQSYGIAHDQQDLLALLDVEASRLAEKEEVLADSAAETEAEMLIEEEVSDVTDQPLEEFDMESPKDEESDAE